MSEYPRDRTGPLPPVGNSGRQPWPLAAKILAPLVVVLIAAGAYAALQPTPSDHQPAEVAARATAPPRHRRVPSRHVTTSQPAPSRGARPRFGLPPLTTALTAPPTTQPPTPTQPPTTALTPSSPKTCADFDSRLAAELWVQYAIGVGIDDSGMTPGPHGEYCPSLPGPDL